MIIDFGVPLLCICADQVARAQFICIFHYSPIDLVYYYMRHAQWPLKK